MWTFFSLLDYRNKEFLLLAKTQQMICPIAPSNTVAYFFPPPIPCCSSTEGSVLSKDVCCLLRGSHPRHSQFILLPFKNDSPFLPWLYVHLALATQTQCPSQALGSFLCRHGTSSRAVFKMLYSPMLLYSDWNIWTPNWATEFTSKLLLTV